MSKFKSVLGVIFAFCFLFVAPAAYSAWTTDLTPPTTTITATGTNCNPSTATSTTSSAINCPTGTTVSITIGCVNETCQQPEYKFSSTDWGIYSAPLATNLPTTVNARGLDNAGNKSTNNPSLTINFQATLTVTIAGTGTGTVASFLAGINCGTDCTETYNHGTSVTLTATPSSNSVFAGWAGACNGPATTCTVTMDASKSVTATFNPSCVSNTGQACNRNACGGTGTYQCDGSCSAPAPANPANYGQACTKTSSPNACGQTSTTSGTIQCDGSCNATTPSTPANPANYGQACTKTSSPNACGQTNTTSGTFQCDGSCSAPTPSTPANPANYGQACNRNACGGTGTYQCDGICSAPAPSIPPAQTPPACRTTGGTVNDGQCGTTTYTANCSGVCQNDQCILPPTVDLQVNNSNDLATIDYGGTADLSWSVTNNPTSCSADLSWSGPKSVPAAGLKEHEFITNLTGPTTYTYRITCYNAAAPNGVSDSVQVNVLGLCSATPNCTNQSCNALPNTCGPPDNGTQNCTLTTLPGQSACTSTQAIQPCTTDRCTTSQGYSCNNGTCALPISGSCSPTPATTITNEPITWNTSNISGGIGGYGYFWSGTDNLSGSGSTVTKSYSTTGPKSANVTVSSGSQTKRIDCSPATINTPPPCTETPINCTQTCDAPANTCSTNNGTITCTLTEPGNCTQVPTYPSCTVDTCNVGASCTNEICIPTVRCSVTPSTPPDLAELGRPVTWTAQASGGSTPYTYIWSGENLSGKTGEQVSIAYVTVGEKRASVIATDSIGRSSVQTDCFNSVLAIFSSSKPKIQTREGDVHTQEQINVPGGQ